MEPPHLIIDLSSDMVSSTRPAREMTFTKRLLHQSFGTTLNLAISAKILYAFSAATSTFSRSTLMVKHPNKALPNVTIDGDALLLVPSPISSMLEYDSMIESYTSKASSTRCAFTFASIHAVRMKSFTRTFGSRLANLYTFSTSVNRFPCVPKAVSIREYVRSVAGTFARRISRKIEIAFSALLLDVCDFVFFAQCNNIVLKRIWLSSVLFSFVLSFTVSYKSVAFFTSPR